MTTKKKTSKLKTPAPEKKIEHETSEFLISAFLGGALASWLAHHNEFTTDKMYFWPVVGINIACNVAAAIVIAAFHLAIGAILMYIITGAVVAYFASAKLKEVAPNYDKTKFEANEKNGIIYGIILCALGSLLYLI